MKSVNYWRHCALWSFLVLIAWIMLWNAVISPAKTYPVALALILLLAPLMPAVRGMLHARPYTHAWMSMVSLLYFLLGVSDAYADPGARVYGCGLIVLSLLLFFGSVFYVHGLRKLRTVSGDQKSA